MREKQKEDYNQYRVFEHNPVSLWSYTFWDKFFGLYTIYTFKKELPMMSLTEMSSFVQILKTT